MVTGGPGSTLVFCSYLNSGKSLFCLPSTFKQHLILVLPLVTELYVTSLTLLLLLFGSVYKMSETESYSEEEVEQCERSENELEQEVAIKAILSESENLEQQQATESDHEHDSETPAPTKVNKGKHKAKKQRKRSVDTSFWEVLSSIQSDIKSLKQKRSHPEDAEDVDGQMGANVKVKKVKVVSCSAPSDRPSSSKTGLKQLSTVNSDEQLRSAKDQQLSPAPGQQLSPAKSKQLSTATKRQLSPARGQQRRVRQKSPEAEVRTDANDDTVDIDVEDSSEDDPLLQEVNLQQNNMNVNVNPNPGAVDESDGESSDENDDDFFQEMVGAIDIRGDEDVPGAALVESWASKINLAWTTKVPKTTMTSLLTKFRTPTNLTDMRVPRMNKEIWRLCDKFQRKNDLNMAQSQRCLIKAATGVLNLHDHFATLPRGTRQLAMQTTVDIVSLLGKVNREVVSKRKMLIRPNLKGDFKYLSSSTNTTEHLFGDNLTQDIKDIQVKRKIENSYNPAYNTFNYRGAGPRRGQFRGGYRGRYNNSNYHGSGNFLGRGRGRDQYHPRGSHNNNQSRQGKK
jgi:hypothetical protein